MFLFINSIAFASFVMASNYILKIIIIIKMIDLVEQNTLMDITHLYF